MRKITVNIGVGGRILSAPQSLVGFGGEHNAVMLCFCLDEDALSHFDGAEYFRVVAEGQYSDKLNITDGAISYLLPQAVMLPPSVHCQLVGYSEDGGEPTLIAKSEVAELSVGFSEVPYKKTDNTPDVFERTLALCSNYSEQAEQSAILAENKANESMLSASEAKDFSESAERNAIITSENAVSAGLSAQRAAEYANQAGETANALKGSASGETVMLKDVSPLTHDIKVKLLGDAVSGGLSKGESLGTVAEVWDEGITEHEWINEDEQGPFAVYQNYVPIDNRTNLYVNIPAFAGAAAGLLLTNGTDYYSVYVCDYNGGEVYCYIDGGELYISHDGKTLMNYYYGEGLKIIGVSCNGENFTGNALDLYECTFDAGVKVYRSGKNHLDAKSLIAYNNGTDYVASGNSFTLRGNEGTENYSYSAGQLMFPYANADNISTKGIQVKAGVVYTLSFDYLLLEQGKYNSNISLFVYNEKVSAMVGTNNVQYAVTFAGELGTVKRYSIKFTPTEDTKAGVCFRINNNYVTISNLQISEDNSTDFEGYIAPTEYIADADGTLTVPSLYPTTRLYTDTEGVTINAEYNRDINKAFGELQQMMAQIQTLAVMTLPENGGDEL